MQFFLLPSLFFGRMGPTIFGFWYDCLRLLRDLFGAQQGLFEHSLSPLWGRAIFFSGDSQRLCFEVGGLGPHRLQWTELCFEVNGSLNLTTRYRLSLRNTQPYILYCNVLQCPFRSVLKTNCDAYDYESTEANVLRVATHHGLRGSKWHSPGGSLRGCHVNT